MPTAIQMQAIPSILSGRDVVGLAATGSGKTLCFILPLLVLLEQQQQQSQHQMPYEHQTPLSRTATPTALIVVPTRELMEQIFHELRFFVTDTESNQPQQQKPSSEGQWVLHGTRFTALGVCGGIALHDHVRQIRQVGGSIDVVVATPGRLLHLIERASISLQRLKYLVMDEVDRMLDVEMEPQLRQILHHCNAVGRQTLLWSATMPHFLDRLARSAVLNPITVRVGMGKQRSGITSLQVTQQVLFMRFAEKKTKLLQVLRTIPAPPVLVFCNSHESVDFVTRVLRHEQFHVASLHGEKSQSYRFQVIAAFRDGYVDVLVATDLASRGLDFADVEHVVIFEMPHTIEDYVHRCGRTGRRRHSGGSGEGSTTKGNVTAFLTIDCAIAKELKQLLQETKQPVPLELQMPGRFQQRQKTHE